MKQQSPEWFKARKGKITGSRVGAILGLNPWQSADDVLREMVREYHGAEREFTGNVATEWGNHHEPIAMLALQQEIDEPIEECGFITHPDHDLFGASPDGLFGESGLVEIKCPYGLRDKEEPEFKTMADQPHYYAQIQMELHCTVREVCIFYQWAPGGASSELVHIDPNWLAENIGILEAFSIRWYEELKNPAHLEPKHKEINTRYAAQLLAEYDNLVAAIDEASTRKKEILEELTVIANDHDAIINGRKLTQVERKGNVIYKNIPELQDVDLEQYRGKPSKYWKLT